MKNTPALLLLLSLFYHSLLCGQAYTGVIKGMVTDKDSRQPLPGARVIISGSDTLRGTVTDMEGRFTLSGLKAGRYTLRFSYVGYEDAVAPEIPASPGKDQVLSIEMKEEVKQMEEVTVQGGRDKGRANNSFATVSARSLSMDEMSRYAGTLNDPARMVQALAGVVSSNDENNAIVIRGNSPRGLLWRLEGLEIPNPNHFAGDDGASGGGVTMLSAQMLARTDFYTGAFPAEMGNASSGVFDLNFRKGNSDRWEFTLQTGVLGVEAALEGPFHQNTNASYLVHYRYSTLDLLNRMGIRIGGDVFPQYQDAAWNFFIPTPRAGKFSFFGLGGISKLGTQVKGNPTEWKTIQQKTRDGQSYMMGTTGITHLYLLPNQKTWIRTALGFSISDQQYTADTLNNQYEAGNIFTNRYRYLTYRLNSVMNHKVNTRWVVKTGLTLSAVQYQLLSNAFQFYSGEMQTRVNEKGITGSVQAFSQAQYRFHPAWTLNFGAHVLFSLINRDWSIEPRVGLEYRIDAQHMLTFGAGLHSREDALSVHVVQFSPQAGKNDNRMIQRMRSAQAVLGYQFSFLKEFRIKAEAYAQYLYGIPVGKDSLSPISLLNLTEDFLTIPLFNSGTGINYGVEVTAEKFFSKQYYFMVSLSLFDSKYNSNGQWRNTAFNARYVVNALGGKEFTVGKRKNNFIGSNVKIVWRGGFRYTPVDIESSQRLQSTQYDVVETNSRQLPDYFRMDFGIYFKRNRKRWNWQLSFDAQNIINRRNIGRYVYDPETQQIKGIRNLGIVPVISFKTEFGFSKK